MVQAESQASYDAWHQQHGVDEAADAPWHLLVQAALNPARDLSGKRVLDIGCGRGGFSCWLSRQPARPAEIVAADFSSIAVEKGRAFAATLGLRGITWSLRDIQATGEPADSFDTVFSFETIEHVPDPPAAVAELARLLKPGGRLFLTTPNYLSMIGLYRAYCWALGKSCDEGGQPICHCTTLPKTLAWVRAAGLRVVRTSSAGQYLPFPGRQPFNLRWLVRPHFALKWFGLHSFVLAEKAIAS